MPYFLSKRGIGGGGAPLDPHDLMETGNPQQLNHKVTIT